MDAATLESIAAVDALSVASIFRIVGEPNGITPIFEFLVAGSGARRKLSHWLFNKG
jgi:hypothetical protein